MIVSRLENMGMAMFALIPVLTIAWFYGCMPGLTAGVLSLFANVLLFQLLGIDWYVRLFHKGILLQGSLAIALIGGMVGRVSDLSRRLKKELSEKNVIENELRHHRDNLQKMVSDQTAELLASNTRLEASDRQLRATNQELMASLQQLKASESTLRESEERFRAITETTPDAIIITDSSAVILYCNKSTERIFGYRRDELTGQPSSMLLAPRFRDREQAGRETYMQTGSSRFFDSSVESVFMRRDGSEIPIEFTISSWQQGNDLLYATILRDITERKQAEQALHENEEKFSTLFQRNPLPLCLSDLTDNRAMDVNEAFTGVFGFTREEMIGRTAVELGLWVNSEQRQECFERLKQLGRISGYPALIRAKSGAIYNTLWSAEIIQIRGVPCLITSTLDITARIHAEEEKKKLQAQLTMAQKMESVGRLAGGVAHDFNNMLGVILGHTEMALDTVNPEQPLYAGLQEIRKAAEHSADLTRQLLAFARRQTAAPKVLDLNKTVERMLTILRRIIGEDIDLTWLPDNNLWPVRVDPTQIDQVLANLCVNARDAIGGMGRITIETGTAVLDEDYCAEHAGCIPGQYVLLAVSDNGCGMEPETIERVFEPFYTTKEMGKGTGLGLAIIYGIVKQNNGYINVYSEPDMGSTFRIYLPRHFAVAESGQVETAAVAAPAVRGSETILLVEDEKAILTMTTTMLEQLGYTVLAAGRPGEAIRLAEQYSGEIHLLMSDVVMPGMNGRDLAGNLLSLYPGLKRLFMSGYTANVIAHHGVLNEGVHFLQKPFSRRDLADKVREALDAP